VSRASGLKSAISQPATSAMAGRDEKVPNIPWINRPTLHQVVQYSASR
jgi:hypothetical protein